MIAPVREGEVLAGKYRVEHMLGQGGMGVVVAATHLQLEQLVAIKFLLPTALEHPEVIARFKREARAAVKIQSEHVARVIDVGELETGAPYIVMEYLAGYDLAQILKQKGPFAMADAVGYVLQACEAIAEAHAVGIVHRDLKPSNLFLASRTGGSSAVKVLDFGISKTVAVPGSAHTPMSITATTAVLGSPLYMSPEQLKSARNVDHRTDIWSLGVVLFELLSGRPPFDAESFTHVVAMIVSEPVPDLTPLRPDLPAGLLALVMRCLEKDPAKRPVNVAELARSLAPYGPAEGYISVERTSRVLGEPPTSSLERRSSVNPSHPPQVQSSSPVGATVAGWSPSATVQLPAAGRTGRGKVAFGLVSAFALIAVAGGSLLWPRMHGHGSVVGPSAVRSDSDPGAVRSAHDVSSAATDAVSAASVSALAPSSLGALGADSAAGPVGSAINPAIAAVPVATPPRASSPWPRAVGAGKTQPSAVAPAGLPIKAPVVSPDVPAQKKSPLSIELK